MYAGVIAVEIGGQLLRLGWFQAEADAIFQFLLKSIRRPTLLEEQKLQASAFAAIAQNIGTAENFRDTSNYGKHLSPFDKCVQAHSQMRLGRKPATNADREAGLRAGAAFADDRGKADVVNLRVGAPRAAAGDGNLELARQIIKIGISGKQTSCLLDERRSVTDFIRVHSGERAAGDVASNVTAGCQRREAAALEAVENIGERLDGDPVELNILTHGEVSDTESVFLCEVGNRSKLVRAKQTIRDTDTNHKIRHGFAFTAVAGNHAGAVSLRIDAPPAEIRAEPFWWNRGVAFAGEAADFREALPGIHGLL